LYLPTMRRYRVLDRYIYNWIRWNKMIEDHVDLIYRLEDLVKNPKEIFEDLGWDIGKKKLNTKKVNTYSNVKQYEWKDFRDCLLYNELLNAAGHYKYLTEQEIKDLKK